MSDQQVANPDLERADAVATKLVAELWNRIGNPKQRIIQIILEQRAEEAELAEVECTGDQDCKCDGSARAAELRRQAGEVGR